MSFWRFLKVTGISIALALAAFALYDTTLLFLAKALALAFAFSIAFSILYPSVRGVKKGDKVQVSAVGNNIVPIFSSLISRGGFALNDGKINKEIRIKLDDGKEAVGIIESYETFLSAPKVRILYEEKMME